MKEYGSLRYSALNGSKLRERTGLTSWSEFPISTSGLRIRHFSFHGRERILAPVSRGQNFARTAEIRTNHTSITGKPEIMLCSEFADVGN
jgi:hypothetical protein